MTEHDELLAELGAALQVEPSAAFAPRVRERVDAMRRRSRWLWFSAAAACATVTVLIMWRPSTRPVMVQPATTSAAAAPTVATPPIVPAPAPTRVGGSPRQSQSVPKLIAASVATAATAPAEPKLEVITNQPALLRALWQSRAVGAVALVAEDSASGSELTVKPITVEPIAVPLVVVNEFVIRR